MSGSVSGTQSNIAQNGVGYTSDNLEVSFVIYEGTIPFATGDTFTFTVDDVIKSGYTYDPALNEDSSATIKVP